VRLEAEVFVVVIATVGRSVFPREPMTCSSPRIARKLATPAKGSSSPR
jgi:hypothetical protein